jgi:hypothetical protein
MIHTPGVFRWIMEAVKPFQPRKARELFESLGLPPAVSKDLASKSPVSTWKTEGEIQIIETLIS